MDTNGTPRAAEGGREAVVTWLEPVVTRIGPVRFERSLNGYGWSLKVGKRLRWNSRNATSSMWPSLHRGGDEHCNRAVSVILWPLGSLDVWWEPRWRNGPGFCAACTDEFRREGFSRLRCCDEHYPEGV